MDIEKKSKLESAGIDVEAALERFMGNEELFLDLIVDFAEDENCSLLKIAMAEKRYNDAFEAAHAMKGLCGNFSVVKVYDIVSREVECLRHEKYAEAEEILPEVIAAYEKTIEILRSL